MPKHRKNTAVEAIIKAYLHLYDYVTPLSLWQTYRSTPTIQLRNKIATANRGLVQKVARKLTHTCHESFEDLEQLCFMGLLKAVEKYDPDKGVAFSSFAVPYIRGEALHHLRDHGATVKIPRAMGEKIAEVKRTQHKLEQMGRQLDFVAVATGMGILQSEAEEMVLLSRWHVPVSLDDDESPIQIASKSDEGDPGRRDFLLTQLAYLPKCSREAVVSRYVLKRDDRAIAAQLSITIDRVQPLIDQAMAQLKGVLNGC